mgnify:CR=1 FL=1
MFNLSRHEQCDSAAVFFRGGHVYLIEPRFR